VEVGVARGAFPATILGKWHGKRLHGVDPWSEMIQRRQVRRYRIAVWMTSWTLVDEPSRTLTCRDQSELGEPPREAISMAKK